MSTSLMRWIATHRAYEPVSLVCGSRVVIRLDMATCSRTIFGYFFAASRRRFGGLMFFKKRVKFGASEKFGLVRVRRAIPSPPPLCADRLASARCARHAEPLADHVVLAFFAFLPHAENKKGRPTL